VTIHGCSIKVKSSNQRRQTKKQTNNKKQ